MDAATYNTALSCDICYNMVWMFGPLSLLIVPRLYLNL